MRDFSIQTVHVIETQRTDFVVADKKDRSCKIIDFAIPRDSRIDEKEKDDRKISRLGKGVAGDMNC